MLDIRDQTVAVVSDGSVVSYPATPPFHPSDRFPEYTGEMSAAPNPVYGLVRQALADLGLDRARFGTPAWNPIGDLVKPGGRIVVKPNWVLHHNQGPGGTDCLITHPSVLRAVLDYVLLAKPGRVVVGDAPVQGCDFDALVGLGSRQVVELMASRGLPVRLADFRRTVLQEGSFHVAEDRQPMGQYVLFDLGSKSLLEPLAADAEKFRITMYDPLHMRENHRPGVHRYLVARDVIEADLIVNLPKLKTHKKAGITAALKNLVGIVGNKEYLPHHRKGPRILGGDNYERQSFLKAAAEEVLDFANRRRSKPRLYAFCNRLVYYLLVADMKLGGSGEVEGSWHGNDTVWRMCLDLNRIAFYGDADGRLHDQLQRKTIAIADGVIAGQGDGPLRSDPYPMGAIVASLSSAALDWIASLLMGIDPRRIPIVSRAFEAAGASPESVVCRINGKPATPAQPAQPACPPRGWKTYLEQSSATKTQTRSGTQIER